MPKPTTVLAPKERLRLEKLYKSAPFGLLVTSHKKYPIPVLLVKEREEINGERQGRFNDREHQFYGDIMRRVLSEGLLARMVSSVTDVDEVPMELGKILVPNIIDRIDLPLQIPLDEEAGFKLGLLFSLSSKLQDKDRVELMARRIDRFAREEAAYWYSRITRMDKDLQVMAMKGLKITLCGDGSKEDRPRVQKALEKLKLN